jgi:hypothetical protein
MYIVEVDSQERESAAIRHLMGVFRDEILQPFGIGGLAWIIVEAAKPKLCPGIVGDVDILAGRLEFRDPSDYDAAAKEIEAKYPRFPAPLKAQLAGRMVAEAHGLAWPPVPTFVVGIEVKCAVFTEELRSAKSSAQKVRGIRKQVEWLERMGLDYTGLLEIVGNEPSYEEHGGFLGAMRRSERSLKAMDDVLANRLPAESAAAHFIWSVGSVGGGDEGTRGAGGPLLLRAPQPNPRLATNELEALTHRRYLLTNVSRLLGQLPCPRYFPVVFLDCRRCGTIHNLDDVACSLSRR